MRNYDAVIAGYICVDLFPEFKKNGSCLALSDILIPGKLVEIEGINFSLGGLVANTGIAMKKFNKKVFLNGLVGDDMIGKIAMEWLGKYILSKGIGKTSLSGTAFSIVIAPPGVDRIFLEYPGCNRIFDSNNIRFDIISRSRLFHFGYPPLLQKFYLDGGKQLHEMFSRVQGLGVITSLDFSLPDTESESGRINWPEIMKQVLPVTDIFVPSLEEALQIMDPMEHSRNKSETDNKKIIDQIPVSMIRDIGRQIIDSGVKILLIKAGHRGAYLLTGDVSSLNEKADLKLTKQHWNHCELWCNAFKADPDKIKNSSGAGDTAAAAFLSAILDGEDPDISLKYAAMAGRNSLYCTDLHEDLNTWNEMSESIKSEPIKIKYFSDH